MPKIETKIYVLTDVEIEAVSGGTMSIYGALQTAAAVGECQGLAQSVLKGLNDAVTSTPAPCHPKN